MITTTSVWQTLDCTRCEGAVIVLIKQSRLGHAFFASWTCPHCGGLLELPIVGEVVFSGKDLGMKHPAEVFQPHLVGW